MRRKNHGLTLVELLFWVFVVACLLLVGGCFSVRLNLKNGDGEKIGQIVKLSKHGLFHKTWEAEIIRGGLNNGNGAFSSTGVDFTIERDSDAEKIRKLMEDQTEVLLKYRIAGVYWAVNSESSGHFLVSVQPAKK